MGVKRIISGAVAVSLLCSNLEKVGAVDIKTIQNVAASQLSKQQSHALGQEQAVSDALAEEARRHKKFIKHDADEEIDEKDIQLVSDEDLTKRTEVLGKNMKSLTENDDESIV